MTRVEFHEEARAEFLAAALYYEGQAPGLGHDFITLVEHTYTRLQEFPEIGRPFGGRLRRIIVPRFPYGLVYRAEAERMFIVAVMHLHRRPGYWRSRLR
ncbi:MAG: type II toxin-antitoxin system RelE/ParE family toxin [Deltaproteobacteria bacterium]|nr:type II toxin-antitoxin system RelE/ParE family toxin [Deltaproteobacteria bacterium]